MKNHVQLNPIIADFKRTDIILLIYKALYFTPPVRIRENIHTPPPAPYGRPRGIFVTIARDFQIILKLELLILALDFMWVDFYIKIGSKFTKSPSEIQRYKAILDCII